MPDLETEIRNIIYNDYGVGNQNIDSEEIYNKLVARGIDPPRDAMADVFDSLKRRGLIKGAARLNSDAAHKHGAYSIMWVDRHVAV
jgi:hypothetical protein